MQYKRRAAIKKNNRQIALERIIILFENSIKTYSNDPELAQQYSVLARKLSMRYKVKLPITYKRMICKNCKEFIVPGVNCRVRTRNNRESHLVITCLNCDSHTRIPLKKRR